MPLLYVECTHKKDKRIDIHIGKIGYVQYKIRGQSDNILFVDKSRISQKMYIGSLKHDITFIQRKIQSQVHNLILKNKQHIFSTEKHKI